MWKAAKNTKLSKEEKKVIRQMQTTESDDEARSHAPKGIHSPNNRNRRETNLEPGMIALGVVGYLFYKGIPDEEDIRGPDWLHEGSDGPSSDAS